MKKGAQLHRGVKPWESVSKNINWFLEYTDWKSIVLVFATWETCSWFYKLEKHILALTFCNLGNMLSQVGKTYSRTHLHQNTIYCFCDLANMLLQVGKNIFSHLHQTCLLFLRLGKHVLGFTSWKNIFSHSLAQKNNKILLFEKWLFLFLQLGKHVLGFTSWKNIFSHSHQTCLEFLPKKNGLGNICMHKGGGGTKD